MENTLSVSEISELVCTRISHDLIGNIGAVSNAVELLEEGDMDFMDRYPFDSQGQFRRADGAAQVFPHGLRR